MPPPRILISRAETIAGERWDDYADRVRAAGGEPVAADLAQGTAFDASIAGLLLTAGADIDPARYGAEPSARLGEINPQRDAYEVALLHEALDRDLAVLAICRGHQLFNVAHGGALHQHLEDREPHRARRGADGESIDSGWHEVAIVPGTLLAAIAGVRSMRTNSRHHQAVMPGGVGEGLTVAATAPDGVVESLVNASQRWALSVQWHPEMAEMGDAFGPLFASFVAAAAPIGDAARRA